MFVQFKFAYHFSIQIFLQRLKSFFALHQEIIKSFKLLIKTFITLQFFVFILHSQYKQASFLVPHWNCLASPCHFSNIRCQLLSSLTDCSLQLTEKYIRYVSDWKKLKLKTETGERMFVFQGVQVTKKLPNDYHKEKSLLYFTQDIGLYDGFSAKISEHGLSPSQ